MNYTFSPTLHLVLESAGIFLGLAGYRRLRRTTDDPFTDGQRLSLLVAATFGALLGSRLLGSLEDPSLFFRGGGEYGAWYYLRAKTIVGGLLGGLWAVEGAKRVLGIRGRSGDVYVYPLILAMVIGRLGCLQMGVLEPTYGLPTDSWLGIDLGDGVRRHATALYEIVFLIGYGGLLRLLGSRFSWRPGRLFMLFLSGYLTYRFAIGFLQPRVLVGGLGSIQWACLLGLVWYGLDEYFSAQHE